MPTVDDGLVLPRPGEVHDHGDLVIIRAPSGALYRSTFGAVLPTISFLNVPRSGRVAYYDLPAEPSSGKVETGPDRVLFIHGVQTPAVGLVPLARKLHIQFPLSHFVLFDLYGHGISDSPFCPHTPELFLDLIDKMLDHLNWPTAHLVGFSFGGMLVSSYVATRPLRVTSGVLIAPAGLLDSRDCPSEHLRGDDEVAARRWVIEWLEGGELVVPPDWQDMTTKGQLVAEAVRQWSMDNHAGHVAAVVAMVRDGGVFDSKQAFVKAAATGVPTITVLGGRDEICDVGRLAEVGFENVAVVPEAGHGVVRDRVAEVADIVGDFWSNPVKCHVRS